MNTTAATWLGSTVACAQCHNHKFDPFSQKDYYRMLAFFDNADYRVEGLGEVVRDKWIVEPELELAPDEVLKKRDALEGRGGSAQEGRSTRATSAAELAAWEKALAIETAELDRPPSRRGRLRLRGRPRDAEGRVLAASREPPADKDAYTVTARDPPSRRSPPSASRRSPIRRCPRAVPAARPPATSSSRGSACTTGTEPVPLARAAADFSEDGRSVAQAIDENEDSGWGVDGQQGRAAHRDLPAGQADRRQRGRRAR